MNMFEWPPEGRRMIKQEAHGGRFPVVLESYDGKLRRIEFLPHRS